jgi:hypothetical protein
MIINVPDLINGLFETFGGVAVLNNCKRVLIDKQVKGVSWLSVLFFSSWGYWNTFYYSNLNQWLSFIGGLLIVLANTWWLYLLFKYRKN